MRASSSAAARGDGLGDAARPRIDLAGVLRADRLPREIPLVEQEERLPARLAARDVMRAPAAPRASTSSSRRSGTARSPSTSSARSRVVGTPSTTSRAARARPARSRRAGRCPRRRASRSSSRRTAGSTARTRRTCRRAHPGPAAAGSASIRPGDGRKSCSGSSAFSRISIACPRRGARPVRDERLARGDAQLLANEVDAGARARSPDARPAAARSAR